MSAEKSFNIFRFLKIDQRQIISSQFLVSVMNEDPEYLRMFLERIHCDNYISQDNFIFAAHSLKDAKRERKFGCADIWIGDASMNLGKHKRIIIENKPGRPHKSKQLCRYRHYLDEAGREGLLYSLSLESGTKKSLQSGYCQDKVLLAGNAREGYKVISYQEHIIPWLKGVSARAAESRGPQLPQVIQQFIEVYEQAITVQHWVDEDRSYQDVFNHEPRELVIDFKAALELHFWNFLVTQIETHLQEKGDASEISSRRLFSYEKIHKRCSERRIDKAYGVIIGDIRIRNSKKYFLQMSKGQFNAENIWEPYHSINTTVDLYALENKSHAEHNANEVLKDYILFSKVEKERG